MNETKGNARTKPRRKPKSLGIPENFERGPLKEREMNSLSDSEKTNEIKINNNKREICHCAHCLCESECAYNGWVLYSEYDPCCPNWKIGHKQHRQFLFEEGYISKP